MQRFVRRLGVGLAALALLTSGPILEAQTASSEIPISLSFQRDVQPFLAQHCFACHDHSLHTAKLDLEAFQSDLAASEHPEVWEKVLEKLRTGKMPPPAMPAPSQEEKDGVIAWIETLVGKPSGRAMDPGRVTARRLNRTEYRNTARDLLARDISLADDFPTDNSGYGFDNIGDVLSLSPMLMEKYFREAKRLSRLAVYGPSLPPEPTVLAHYLAKRSADSSNSLSASNILPYSMRGALYGNYIFPVDAEYEFRIRVVDRRRNVSAPETVALSLDGRRILSDGVEGGRDGNYERGEIVTRVSVSAGEHSFRASFPRLANLDPRDNVHADQIRNLFVEYLDIVGPFNSGTVPQPSRQRIFVCGSPDGPIDAACERKIVAHLAGLAFRRPAEEQEVEGLLRFASLARAKGETQKEGIRLALQALLVSPSFLFRIERDPDPNDPEAAHFISEFELASRLSYFLWGSMPDEELLRTAGEGELRKPGVLQRQVRRMLADAKAANLVEDFAAQWLQLRQLERAKPDPARFTTIDDELLQDMRRETAMFVGAVIQEDRSILDFLDASFTFVNGSLAFHYGIPGVTGEDFQRVSLDGEQRSGLLTQGSILTVSSYPTRTSPVLRGKWIMENILGAPPPPPPPNVPVLEESKVGATASLREQMEQHRANPSCAVCHNQIDPLGFVLENYDATGAWRTQDGNFPIDSSGTLPDGTELHGAKELKAMLARRPDAFARSLTEKMLTYALGRGLEPYDSSSVDEISSKVAAEGYRFSSLVTEIVQSRPFQMRRGDGGTNESE